AAHRPVLPARRTARRADAVAGTPRRHGRGALRAVVAAGLPAARTAGGERTRERPRRAAGAGGRSRRRRCRRLRRRGPRDAGTHARRRHDPRHARSRLSEALCYACRMNDVAAPDGTAPSVSPLTKRFRGYLPVVVDVETGGFDWNRHALLEIAAVPIDLDESGRFVPGVTACAHLEPAPGTEIDPKSLEVTGIVLDHPFRMAKPEKQALDHVFAAVRAAVRKYNCQRAI